MTQPEARLQRRIQELLKVRGAFVFKVHGSEFMMAGLPDLVACVRGQFIGFEVKMPGGNTSPRQEYVHERIAAAGGRVHVVTSTGEVARILDSLDATACDECAAMPCVCV